ncbi:MAG: GNAT family N-acetyltransferase [Candidatus Thorarchaeota archaeon]
MNSQFNIKNIVIKDFDPLSSTAEEWKLYHEFRKIRHEEVNPDDPYIDNETAEKNIKTSMAHPEVDFFLYSIIDIIKNKQIGTVSCILIKKTAASYEGNKHLIQFDMSILAPYRRKGIGTKALKFIYDFAIENNKTTLITGSDEGDGKKFLEIIGAQTALTGVENRLNLEEVDWEMVSQWEKEGLDRSPKTKLQFFYTIPENIIEKYSEIYTETNNQQPLGDLDVGDIIFTPETLRQMEKRHKDLGRKQLTYITIEQDGEISGLTEMIYRPERDYIIEQLLTGVKDKHRGRGLGKWLKATMLLRIKEEFPNVKIVSTGNATTNAPMLSINDRLGFKVHKESMTGQLTVETLGKYLESK